MASYNAISVLTIGFCRRRYISVNTILLSYRINMIRSVHNLTENDNYKAALSTLSQLISNTKDLQDASRRHHDSSRLLKTKECISRCGLRILDLQKSFSIIHVSGTKGKGSTCAFCESILRQHGLKTGFFSSPHLISVRERIRINGEPLSKPQFTHYFWDVYEKMVSTKTLENEMPTYAIFLTVMALQVFYVEGVDVVILEVGIGGEYDSTNIFNLVDVVGITSLGYDHTNLLGNTIEEISWQKAGIMKPGCVAITSRGQCIQALRVMKDRAAERQCKLFEALPLDTYTCESGHLKLGINGPKQHLNASLAIQLANCILNRELYNRLDSSEPRNGNVVAVAPAFEITEKMAAGLKSAVWQGRTQIVEYSPRVTYYLDGAHNVDSMLPCVQWYLENFSKRSTAATGKEALKKVLVLYISGTRPVSELINILIPCQFDFAFFCPNVTYINFYKLPENPGVIDDEELQKRCEFIYNEWSRCGLIYSEWLKLNTNSKCKSTMFDSMWHMLQYLLVLENTTDCHYQVLVTGSLYVVGGVLGLLEKQPEDLET